MDILTTLEQIALDLEEVVEEELDDIGQFFAGAYEYEAKNLKPQLAKIVADCMAAAEKSLTTASGSEKYAFAFSNIVAAAAEDALVFSESAIDFAVQSVIAERNKRLAAA